MLLSWLLPVVVLLVGGFAVSLPFTGLEPLWAIGHATALLLAAAAVLIVLINAAYQDGEAERQPPQLLRWSARGAAVLTVPLTLIGAYALFLRVGQYGWTVDRVTVAAILAVALSLAGAYAFAALAKGPWLVRIQAWNFNIALLVVALVVLLLTPIASPMRIAVNDQMARLNRGATEPQKFDFAFLRDHGGRYGQAALRFLTQGSDALLRRRAQAMLDRQSDPKADLTPQIVADQITVYPRGEQLPQSFLRPEWRKEIDGGCLGNPDMRCDAVLLDLDGDGRKEVMLFQNGVIVVYREAASGWTAAGNINLPRNCPKILDALKAGTFRIAPPDHGWNDVMIGETRLTVREGYGNAFREAACPR
jgi:hypothetical protein